MTKIDEISFFLPCYNEEKNVEYLVKKAMSVLKKLVKKWEVIVVDDGSKDKTGEISDKLQKKYKDKLKVIHHSPNRGYGGALKSGYEASKYKWVAFADGDRQFDINELELFLMKQEETKADLILGIRKERADSLIRIVFTFVWSKLLPRLIFNLKVTDYSCGFKLIRKEVYKKVQPLIGEEKVTQIEMLVKAQKLGFKFAEVNVTHLPRKYGHQTGADIKVILRSVKDLLILWWKLR